MSNNLVFLDHYYSSSFQEASREQSCLPISSILVDLASKEQIIPPQSTMQVDLTTRERICLPLSVILTDKASREQVCLPRFTILADLTNGKQDYLPWLSKAVKEEKGGHMSAPEFRLGPDHHPCQQWVCNSPNSTGGRRSTKEHQATCHVPGRPGQ